MPRVAFTEANKVTKSSSNFPRLKLEKGEKARIAILEDPVVEYRHTLRAPVVLNGQVKTHEVPRRDGTTYTDYEREFVASPLCTGDLEVLANVGIDPENCLVCAYVKANKDRAEAPQRRYAMHVIQYKTKPGKTEVSTPFSVDLVVWAFSDKTFNTITEHNSTWAEQGGLKSHDLLLTCTNAVYQNFEFAVDPTAAWQKTESTKSLTAETFKENQIEDLSLACGQRKEERWLKEDLKRVDEAWDLVDRIQGNTSEADADVADLSEGVADLLDDSPAASSEDGPSESPFAGGKASFADLIS